LSSSPALTWVHDTLLEAGKLSEAPPTAQHPQIVSVGATIPRIVQLDSCHAPAHLTAIVPRPCGPLEHKQHVPAKTCSQESPHDPFSRPPQRQSQVCFTCLRRAVPADQRRHSAQNGQSASTSAREPSMAEITRRAHRGMRRAAARGVECTHLKRPYR